MIYDLENLQTALKNQVKAQIFVKHIEAHIEKAIHKGKLPKDSVVICKFCKKSIDEIFDFELGQFLFSGVEKERPEK